MMITRGSKRFVGKFVVTVGMMAVAIACGGGDGGGGGNTTANPQQASQAVSSTGTLQSSIGAMNGEGAGGALNAIGASAQAIVQPDFEGQPSALLQLQEVLGQIQATGTVAAANAPGDCICNASGCTFDQCGIGSGFEISGTITKSGDTYTIDVNMTANTTGIMYEWSYQGAITITATLIDGNLAGDGSGTFSGDGQTVSFDFDWEVTYHMIGLDAQGCPTSGSLDASVSYSVDGTGGSGNYSGDATITFGPTCGAATAS